jgi:hypothetical protein
MTTAPAATVPPALSLGDLSFETSTSIGEGCELVFVRRTEDVMSAEDPVRLYVEHPSAVVVEEQKQATVPTVRATNVSDGPVLIIAGQVIRGGRQNRGINADVLIDRHASVDLPVSCVEQGRWSAGAGRGFEPSGIEPMMVRAEKQRQVSASLRQFLEESERDDRRGFRGPADVAYRSDQQAVWRMVRDELESTGTHSASADLVASIESRAHHEDAGWLEVALDGSRDRCGVLVFLGGSFMGADVFANPSWFRACQRDLVRSAHSLRFSRHRPPAREWAERGGRMQSLAEAVIRDAGSGAWVDGRPLGCERPSRLEHPFLEGACTRSPEGRVLHVQLAPAFGATAFRN